MRTVTIVGTVTQIIPLEHVYDVLREPVLEFDGDLFFVVAQGWTPEELKQFHWEDEAFGHRLVRIDETGRGQPRRPMRGMNEYMTPAEVLERLLAGERITLNGHTAEYEADLMVTWCTNAYGIDGILCNGKPTLDDMTRFVADMAAGKEYGPTP